MADQESAVVEQPVAAADDPHDIRDPYREAEKEVVREVVEEIEAEEEAEEEGEEGGPDEEAEEEEPTKPPVEKPVPADLAPAPGELNPAEYLDEDLAKIVQSQQRQIAALVDRLSAAGISDPSVAAMDTVAEEFPDVFGQKGVRLSDDQAAARDKLSEAIEMLRSGYARSGKTIPTHDKLVRMAMNVEFPDLSQSLERRQVKSKARDSQRLPRPTARTADLSPEERAVKKLREKMLKLEIGD
jgi:hypothetical protein